MKIADVNKVILHFVITDYYYYTKIEGLTITVDGTAQSVNLYPGAGSPHSTWAVDIPVDYHNNSGGKIVVSAPNPAQVYGAVVSLSTMSIYF